MFHSEYRTSDWQAGFQINPRPLPINASLPPKKNHFAYYAMNVDILKWRSGKTIFPYNKYALLYRKMSMNTACYWSFVHLSLELCNDLFCHNSSTSTRILAFEICIFTQIEKESSFSSLILSRNLQCNKFTKQSSW